MTIEEIRFKRTEKSIVEQGIIIDNGTGPILDMKGSIVEECWNYEKTYRYCITIPEYEVSQTKIKL